jgi:hypothetical protein
METTGIEPATSWLQIKSFHHTQVIAGQKFKFDSAGVVDFQRLSRIPLFSKLFSGFW